MLQLGLGGAGLEGHWSPGLGNGKHGGGSCDCGHILNLAYLKFLSSCLEFWANTGEGVSKSFGKAEQVIDIHWCLYWWYSSFLRVPKMWAHWINTCECTASHWYCSKGIRDSNSSGLLGRYPFIWRWRACNWEVLLSFAPWLQVQVVVKWNSRSEKKWTANANISWWSSVGSIPVGVSWSHLGILLVWDILKRARRRAPFDSNFPSTQIAEDAKLCGHVSWQVKHGHVGMIPLGSIGVRKGKGGLVR